MTNPALPSPPQFSIDELRRQMDKKHNIRNMSVIAHVDHVSIGTHPCPRTPRLDSTGIGSRLGTAVLVKGFWWG